MMMKDELGILHELTGNLIRYSRGNKCSPSAYGKWQGAFHTECSRLQKKIIQLKFTVEKEKLLERFVRHYQQEMITMADQAFYNKSVLQKTPSFNWSAMKGHDLILDGLTELLFFIKKHFPEQFDPHQKTPEGYFSQIRRGKSRDLLVIKKAFMQKEIGRGLIDILLDYLHFDRKPGVTNPITFHELDYARQLKKELLGVAYEQGAENWNDRLLRELVRLNFNTSRVYHYWVEELTRRVDPEAPFADQLGQYTLVLKQVNQLPVDPHLACRPSLMSLKEGLCNYIKEEIVYTRELIQIALEKQKAAQLASAHYRCRTVLTGKQLAFYARLHTEAGIILEGTPKKYQEFVLEHVGTRGVEHLSPVSFKSDYYESAPGDAQKVYGLVEEMLRLIRDKYWCVVWVLTTLY